MRDACRVNSLHRQAVERPGGGLSVVARDIDDIPQGGGGSRISGSGSGSSGTRNTWPGRRSSAGCSPRWWLPPG
ncbi:MAG: hypothetical protein U5R48_15455 [Gammaproteobacteria bacterium]|nr:hypothetical protein [Gammaproteobacteria bacterium]